MKNVKTFYESQTAICVKLPTKQKLPYISEINIFGRIFTGMHKFAFQVLRECSFWASRNGAVQMFFLTPTRKPDFGCVARVYF